MHDLPTKACSIQFIHFISKHTCRIEVALFHARYVYITVAAAVDRSSVKGLRCLENLQICYRSALFLHSNAVKQHGVGWTDNQLAICQLKIEKKGRPGIMRENRSKHFLGRDFIETLRSEKFDKSILNLDKKLVT